MNKSVKVIMAIAIGVIYPILVLFIALVFYPTSNYTQPKESYPAFPDYSKCESIYSSNGSKSRTLYDSCRKAIDLEYKNKLNEYDQKIAEYERNRDKLVIDRVQVALISAILGFILATIAYKFSPITVGMAGGSTVLVIFSSSYGLSASDALSTFAVILFTICFVALIAMLFFVDKVLPKSSGEDFVQKKATTPASTK